MGVDISPVIHCAFVHPMAARQRLQAIGGTEYDDGVTHLRESQKVGLVLGDEYALHGDVHGTETFGVQSNVGTYRAGHHLYTRIEHPEANARRLV